MKKTKQLNIIFTRGISGSGKTYWSKQYVLDNPSYMRVSMDDLRHMRGEYWIPTQEKVISKQEIALIEINLSMGYNVLVDATNLSDDKIKSRIDKLKLIYPNLSHEIKIFNTPIDVCIERDKKRSCKTVGENVIRKQVENLKKYNKKTT